MFAGSGNYIAGNTERTLLGPPCVSVLVNSDPVTSVRASVTLKAAENWSATLYADNITNW